jgi:REP element-mobilizing transposase RayT
MGKIVNNVINEMNETYEKIQIDNYIIMPNHVHMIVEIYDEEGSSRTPTPTNAKLPFLISTFKRFSNKQIGHSIWQRNYYEHVIRNEKEVYKIIEYIEYNPINWESDCNYKESK